MEKRGSDEAGSAALPVAPFASEARTHRTHALGHRVLPDSRGCAHGRAAQVACSRPRALWGLPIARTPSARPLGASATHSKNWHFLASRHRAGCGRPSAHDAPAGRLGSSSPETRHSLGNGCETRARSERPPGEVPRGARENEGPMKQGRRHRASWLFASHLARWLDSSEARTHRTQALGDRALPDFVLTVCTADACAKPPAHLFSLPKQESCCTGMAGWPHPGKDTSLTAAQVQDSKDFPHQLSFCTVQPSRIGVVAGVAPWHA